MNVIGNVENEEREMRSDPPDCLHAQFHAHYCEIAGTKITHLHAYSTINWSAAIGAARYIYFDDKKNC